MADPTKAPDEARANGYAMIYVLGQIASIEPGKDEAGNVDETKSKITLANPVGTQGHTQLDSSRLLNLRLSEQLYKKGPRLGQPNKRGKGEPEKGKFLFAVAKAKTVKSREPGKENETFSMKFVDHYVVLDADDAVLRAALSAKAA